MVAETVFNVAQSLPPSERARLLVLLQRDVEPIKPKLKKADEKRQWTSAEATDWLKAHLGDYKKRKFARINAELKKV